MGRRLIGLYKSLARRRVNHIMARFAQDAQILHLLLAASGVGHMMHLQPRRSRAQLAPILRAPQRPLPALFPRERTQVEPVAVAPLAKVLRPTVTQKGVPSARRRVQTFGKCLAPAIKLVGLKLFHIVPLAAVDGRDGAFFLRQYPGARTEWLSWRPRVYKKGTAASRSDHTLSLRGGFLSSSPPYCDTLSAPRCATRACHLPGTADHATQCGNVRGFFCATWAVFIPWFVGMDRSCRLVTVSETDQHSTAAARFALV